MSLVPVLLVLAVWMAGGVMSATVPCTMLVTEVLAKVMASLPVRSCTALASLPLVGSV